MPNYVKYENMSWQLITGERDSIIGIIRANYRVTMQIEASGIITRVV